MEVSQRTAVKNKLRDSYGIIISKNDLYRLVCEYNDRGIRMGTFSDAIEELYYIKDAMDDFVRWLKDKSRPSSFFYPEMNYERINPIGREVR